MVLLFATCGTFRSITDELFHSDIQSLQLVNEFRQVLVEMVLWILFLMYLGSGDDARIDFRTSNKPQRKYFQWTATRIDLLHPIYWQNNLVTSVPFMSDGWLLVDFDDILYLSWKNEIFIFTLSSNVPMFFVWPGGSCITNIWSTDMHVKV